MSERFVSDSAVEKIIAEMTMSREKRRAIQTMNREELQRYVVNIYRAGFEDGAEAIQKRLEMTRQAQAAEEEEIAVEWSDVLEAIAEVKGIGPKMLQEIDAKLREKY